jgi:hypothetical protein
MIYTLVILASVSRSPPAMAVVETWFSSLASCQAAGQAWVDAANAVQRNIGAAFVCFSGPSAR